MSLGWYVHHHGRGHLHRFLAVAPHLGAVTALSSLPRPPALADDVRWIELPLDVPVAPEREDTVAANGMLHWAPLGPGGFRDRMAALVDWIDRAQPDAIVVDVSVEVALAARLLGVPVIWVSQRGVRTDIPHQLAFTAAERLIAPWTAASDEDPDAGKRVHVGAVSRFDDRVPSELPGERRVALLLGFGGHAISAPDVAAAAAATPDWRWEVTGIAAPVAADNVISHGSGVDVWALLQRCAVVAASASGNAIAEVAAARRPLICLPQERPFSEQLTAARALAAVGLVQSAEGWPAPDRWPALLAEARAWNPSGWARFHDGLGAGRFAAAVLEVADGSARDGRGGSGGAGRLLADAETPCG